MHVNSMRFMKFYLVAAFLLALVACSDDDDGTEFMFDREISEVSILNECPPDVPEGTPCFKIRYRNPILTHNESGDVVFKGLRVWLGTDVVDDTSKSVSNKQIEKAKLYEYVPKSGSFYDTLDLTDTLSVYIKENGLDQKDMIQVALFCEYSDGGDPGAVERVFLHLGDDQPPSVVEFSTEDSLWSTGARVEWLRPMDKINVHTPSENSGKIFGYKIRIWASDPDEDLSKLTVMVESPTGVDFSGNKFYKRDSWFLPENNSVRVEKVTNSPKNYLHLVILDGEGYDTENKENNRFRLTMDGLRTQSSDNDNYYTIAISAWDVSGNRSGAELTASVDSCHLIRPTDSIAPLMPTKIFTMEDSLFPGYTKLDSNNRVFIYWSISMDPLRKDHGIDVDSVLTRPSGCGRDECFVYVRDYVIEYYDKIQKSWNKYSYAGGDDRYEYMFSRNKNGVFDYDEAGTFITDTIRWVAPGDTLILRIRSKDASKYMSKALVDTLYISPGKVASELKCPDGFVAVSTSDTTSFCMERLEHRGKDGKFITNVLHSEAVAACEAVSASGFEVSLCGERDWELVCLSGGSLAYGVIEEAGSQASNYLFLDCNVSTNDSASAADITKRNPHCMNPMGVRDLPGQYQEWVMGRSKDTIAVLKGSSYKIFEGLDHETIAYCTNRAFPFYTRPAYTQDSVFLYREGTKVDTVYEADSSRTLHKVITKEDFTDTLQFYDVLDADGNVVGTDYSLYSEYKNGGDAWLDSLSNGLKYKPSRKEAVFLKGEKVNYREASSFYKSPIIGFRCCAYKK